MTLTHTKLSFYYSKIFSSQNTIVLVEVTMTWMNRLCLRNPLSSIRSSQETSEENLIDEVSPPDGKYPGSTHVFFYILKENP